MDHLARSEHGEAGRDPRHRPRGAGRVRGAQPRLTARAWDEGFYDAWVVPVPGTELTQDENLRRDTSLEKLARLKPAFVTDGTVTAGNASPLNDGAGALLLGDDSLPGEPLARIVARGVHAVDPDIFGIAPVEAANQALARAGIGWEDVEAVELNEAFAAQSLACVGEWTGLDPDRVNVRGGAIAIGHPLGASGTRILGTLAYELGAAAAATASPPSASASGRGSPWSSIADAAVPGLAITH